jgi:hypothetical protein
MEFQKYNIEIQHYRHINTKIVDAKEMHQVNARL